MTRVLHRKKDRVDGEPSTPPTDRTNHEFRRFWAASAISNLGDGIRLAALPLLALDVTTDARLIAGVTAMSFLPWIVVGPIAGAMVDRWDRRRLMLLGQLARSVAVLLLAGSVSAGWVTIGLLYVVALIVGVGETIVDSASQAAIPRLVEDRDLERANGRLTVAEQLFNHVVGVALGSLLFSIAPGVPFYVDAATFVGAAFLVATIGRPLQGPRLRSDTTIRSDLAEGLRYLLHHGFLRLLAFSVAATNIALNMGLGVMVVLVVDEIGSTEAGYGTVLAAGAIGGVAGSMVAGRLVALLTPQRTLRLVHIPFVASSITFAVATNAWMVSVAFALSGFALVLFQIPSRAMRQRIVPERLLGRVVAAFRIFGLGGPVVGAPIGGIIAQVADVRWAFAGSSFVMLLAWAFVLMALRRA